MKKNLLTFIPLFISSLAVTSCGTYNYQLDDYEFNIELEKDDFKIMQLTDIHLGIETDNVDAMDHVSYYIKDNNPDLIVITGDTFLDADKGIVKYFISRMDENKIPYAFTYGNHDLQGSYHDYYIAKSLMNSKYAMYIDYSNDTLTGEANYYINLNDNGKTLYRLYIIDSNSYKYNGVDYDYDVIHEDQLNHIRMVNENNNALGLAFFHIPLWEYKDAYNAYLSDKSLGNGENREKVAYGYENNGSLKSMFESGIRATFVGHDHINHSNLIYKGFDEDVILSYGVKATTAIYYNADMLGTKIITLSKNDVHIGLDCIEDKFYDYSL